MERAIKTARSTAALGEGWSRYTDEVLARLKKGAAEYGDRSFGKSLLGLIREMKQEAADVSGWGFIVWYKLDSMERKLSGLESELRKKVSNKQ